MSKEFALAVDPGKVTGWAWWRTVGERRPDSGEDHFIPFLRRAEGWLQRNGPRTLVIVERFLITRKTAKNTQAPWSLETIGGLRYLADKHGADWREHNPSDRRFATTSKLKRVGFWHVGGEGHAKDALKHLLVASVKEGWLAPEAIL